MSFSAVHLNRTNLVTPIPGVTFSGGIMKPTLTQRDDFLAFRPVPGLTFALNDYVNVIGGDLAGDSGTVISLEEIGADPVYLVKLDSDKHALLPASFLQPEGDN